MLNPFISSFFIKSVTATGDGAFRVVDDPQIVLRSCNIKALSNDAYFGGMMEQTEELYTGTCVWFENPVRPFDFMFKNLTAGSNTKIVIYGILEKMNYGEGGKTL